MKKQKIEYVYFEPGKSHPVKYRLSVWLQSILWFIGIARHNHYGNECTPDFNCCNKGLGRWCWWRIPERRKGVSAILNKLKEANKYQPKQANHLR
jgi:hypothetical protein